MIGAAALIFGLRIIDVSLGTLRIAMLVRGHRLYAGLLGFFESLVWLIAAAEVLSNLDSPLKYIGYAGGYAAGTMLGTTIEKWMALGSVLVRIIEQVNEPDTVEPLRAAGYYATVMNARGRDGEVQIIFTVIPRRKQAEVLRIIQQHNPRAYVTFEQTSRTSVATVDNSPLQVPRKLLRSGAQAADAASLCHPHPAALTEHLADPAEQCRIAARLVCSVQQHALCFQHETPGRGQPGPQRFERPVVSPDAFHRQQTATVAPGRQAGTARPPHPPFRRQQPHGVVELINHLVQQVAARHQRHRSRRDFVKVILVRVGGIHTPEQVRQLPDEVPVAVEILLGGSLHHHDRCYRQPGGMQAPKLLQLAAG